MLFYKYSELTKSLIFFYFITRQGWYQKHACSVKQEKFSAICPVGFHMIFLELSPQFNSGKGLNSV